MQARTKNPYSKEFVTHKNDFTFESCKGIFASDLKYIFLGGYTKEQKNQIDTRSYWIPTDDVWFQDLWN